MNADLKSRLRWHLAVLAVLLVVACTLVALPASAQVPFGAIDGVVRDESGAVLPGVTVELTSPALIERTRAAVTDAIGNYRFLRLPVGTYAVRFSLLGFGTVERGNIEISSGFTATINAELNVSAVEQTITVTGESPLVDVRTTTSQFVMSAVVVDTIPSSRNVMDIPKFIIGFSTARPEVGGSESESYGSGWQIHGSRANDRSYYRDGVAVIGLFGSGDAPHSYGGTGAQEETNYQTTAIPASIAYGGIAMIMVSKSGGNNFSGTFFSSGFNQWMQWSNLDDTLKDLGVKATSGGKKGYDVDGSFGGPIKKDRLWFFWDSRVYSFNQLLANAFTLDGEQQDNFMRRSAHMGKVTWQINQTNKLGVSFSTDTTYRPYRRSGATFVMPEAASLNTIPPNGFVAVNWNSTRGNSWLFEVQGGYFDRGSYEQLRPESNDVARLDIVTSVLSGAPTRLRLADQYGGVVNASVTRVANWLGSHQIRAGGQVDGGQYQTRVSHPGDIFLRFRNGVPDSVDLVNSPTDAKNSVRNIGVYLQDEWTIAGRLTINAGVRYDDIRAWIPDQFAEAGTWVPERQTTKIDAQRWRTVVPRLGISYDLTGKARTVLKVSASRYVGNESTGLAEDVNPIFEATNRCAWTDTNHDLYAQASEISRCAGWSGGVTTTKGPDLQRPFNNEYSLGIQHQLKAYMAVSVMYNRRENRNARATRNLAVPYDSYIPVVITNPLSNQPLTIYNQNPATSGRQQLLLVNDSKLDNNYNGIEASIQYRYSAETFMQAGYHYGLNLGRISAGELNDPNADIFAYGAVSNDEPHQFKLSGSHVLPGRISVSGSFILNSGHPRVRTLNVGRALVPTLTRATQTVRLERNDENRYDKWSMLDLRLGRVFGAGKWHFEPFVDLYNLLNSNTVLTEVTTMGPDLGKVSTTINPRLVRVGGKIRF